MITIKDHFKGQARRMRAEAVPQTSPELWPRCKVFTANCSQVCSQHYCRSLEGCLAVSYAGAFRKHAAVISHFCCLSALCVRFKPKPPLLTKPKQTARDGRWGQRLLSSQGRDGRVQRSRAIPIYFRERSKVSCIVYIHHCTTCSALHACRKKRLVFVIQINFAQ